MEGVGGREFTSSNRFSTDGSSERFQMQWLTECAHNFTRQAIPDRRSSIRKRARCLNVFVLTSGMHRELESDKEQSCVGVFIHTHKKARQISGGLTEKKGVTMS